MGIEHRQDKNRAFNLGRSLPKTSNESKYFPKFTHEHQFGYHAFSGGKLKDIQISCSATNVDPFFYKLKINSTEMNIPGFVGTVELQDMGISPNTSIGLVVEEGVELKDLTIKFKHIG